MKRLLYKKYGFTLAETLITLGIIGVVASLTMPVLVQNHRKHVVETRLQRFYSVINQAIKLSEVDNGDRIYWEKLETGFEEDEDGNPDVTKSKVTPWFNKYLKPYLHLVKVETSKDPEGRVAAYFPDGSLVLIAGSSWIYFPNAKDYKAVYVEEKERFDFDRPGGTKCFTFVYFSNIKHKVVDPYCAQHNFSLERIKNDGQQGCYNKNASVEHAFCSTLIQRNGWKIPADYPYRF